MIDQLGRVITNEGKSLFSDCLPWLSLKENNKEEEKLNTKGGNEKEVGKHKCVSMRNLNK